MKEVSQTNLITLLRQISRLEHARSHELLEELGLYRGQHRILQTLWDENGLTHTELAQRAHVKPATISTTIQRMETAGLVERKQDLEDQRVSRVFLTETGRELQEDVERATKNIESEVFAEFTPEEQMLLRRLFLQMRENLMQVTDGKHLHRRGRH